jgi:DNA polymerase-3 subunit delta
MGQHEKVLPIQMVLPTLLSFFMRALQFHWLKSTGKTTNMAQAMGVNPYFMREYEAMARNYTPAKVIKIIHHLREYDMRSKGWNTADNDAGKLMKELVFKIIH